MCLIAPTSAHVFLFCLLSPFNLNSSSLSVLPFNLRTHSTLACKFIRFFFSLYLLEFFLLLLFLLWEGSFLELIHEEERRLLKMYFITWIKFNISSLSDTGWLNHQPSCLGGLFALTNIEKHETSWENCYPHINSLILYYFW